jgi:hypothetical protein
MYKYKYVLTMLALFCFNVAITNFLIGDELVANTVLFIGCILLVGKVYFIIQNENLDGLKNQAKQWLFEISLFIGYVGYSVSFSAPLYSAILVVTGVCGILAFIGVALHTEMSKM